MDGHVRATLPDPVCRPRFTPAAGWAKVAAQTSGEEAVGGAGHQNKSCE